MSTPDFAGLPPELRLRIYHDLFTYRSVRRFDQVPPPRLYEPAILRTCRLYRREGLGPYRHFLEFEQAFLESCMAFDVQYDNRSSLSESFRQRLRASRRDFGAFWSPVRIELERLRYFESGGVALRGNKSHGGGDALGRNEEDD
ncbi:unnamed protein product [Zymoseptoria tritici ST99CH_3D1]|nr:unnamed protein product [Zymoseptoria tritici ST99CH_3D1]